MSVRHTSVTAATSTRRAGDRGTGLAACFGGSLWDQGGNERDMDDKIEGKWDQGKGKVKEEAGKLGGDKSTELGGKVDQGKGKLKEGLGNLKEGLHDDERVEE